MSHVPLWSSSACHSSSGWSQSDSSLTQYQGQDKHLPHRQRWTCSLVSAWIYHINFRFLSSSLFRVEELPLSHHSLPFPESARSFILSTAFLLWINLRPLRRRILWASVNSCDDKLVTLGSVSASDLGVFSIQVPVSTTSFIGLRGPPSLQACIFLCLFYGCHSLQNSQYDSGPYLQSLHLSTVSACCSVHSLKAGGWSPLAHLQHRLYLSQSATKK